MDHSLIRTAFVHVVGSVHNTLTPVKTVADLEGAGVLHDVYVEL